MKRTVKGFDEKRKHNNVYPLSWFFKIIFCIFSITIDQFCDNLKVWWKKNWVDLGMYSYIKLFSFQWILFSKMSLYIIMP